MLYLFYAIFGTVIYYDWYQLIPEKIMKKLDVWFVVSEVAGLIKSGGLADVAKALPKALTELDKSVAVVLPAYRGIKSLPQSKWVLSTQLDHWPHTEYHIRYLKHDGVDTYLIDCPQYFDRPEMYAESNEAYPDNGERFAFLSAAALDVLPKLSIDPQVVHANDWHTGLVPFLLKTRYVESLPHVKSVLTIHNAVFQGNYARHELATIPELAEQGGDRVCMGDGFSMIRAGIHYADKINAVSPNYAEELKTNLGAHGLAQDFIARQADLNGIVNGCDTSEWNPQTDPHIPTQYNTNKQSLQVGKRDAKKALQAKVGLEQSDKPLFGMVCRITYQKGFQYLIPILDRFLSNDVQLVIVGTGDPNIAHDLKCYMNLYADKFKFVEAYDNELAHLVEAGSDFFVMPSEFEACGLNQIYSMAYGTLPIVRTVGGLKDTVNDIDDDRASATGVCFNDPTPEALLIALQRALIFYLQDPEGYSDVQITGMTADFSWLTAAKSYIELYQLSGS